MTCYRLIHGYSDRLLADALNAHIKFIELFPPNDPNCIPVDVIKQMIRNHGFMQLNDGNRKVDFSNGRIVASVTQIFCAAVLGQTNPDAFCRKNNDLFLSPEGRAKPCRYDAREVDMLQAIKSRNTQGVLDKITEVETNPIDCLKYLSAIMTIEGKQMGGRRHALLKPHGFTYSP